VHNDNIVSFMGNEGVEFRHDKPRPVTSTGNCRALLSCIDGFRRLVGRAGPAPSGQPITPCTSTMSEPRLIGPFRQAGMPRSAWR
jgi:hypothetical protein